MDLKQEKWLSDFMSDSEEKKVCVFLYSVCKLLVSTVCMYVSEHW